MAYLKKNDLVIFNSSAGRTTALVSDLEWRRFRKSYKDRKTGEQKYKLKSVPYAICTITTTTQSDRYSVGSKMIIAGYKLRNHIMKGEKCLVLENQYLAEFEEDGHKWVVKMLEENKKKSSK